MKYFKLSNPILLCFAATIFFGMSSCKKVKVFEPLGDAGPKYIGIMTYGGPEGYDHSSIALDLSQANASMEVRLLYTGPTVFDNDVTVTMINDAAALAKFNASQPAGGIIFDALSAAQYTLPSTTVKLRAGQSVSDAFIITFHPNLLDASKSYMLPIAVSTITGAPEGVVKAPGTYVAYLHIIGNPIAGTYNNVGTRYNYGGYVLAGWNGQLATMPAGSTPVACGTPKVVSAISPTLATTYYANLGAGTDRDYYFVYDASISTTNIDVSFTPSFEAGISNIGKWAHTYDPVLKQIYMRTSYNNLPALGGADRVVDERMTHQ